LAVGPGSSLPRTNKRAANLTEPFPSFREGRFTGIGRDPDLEAVLCRNINIEIEGD
jgi:hypothetical protein